MASQTITSFPAGASVGVYPASNWLQSQLPPSGAPQGSATFSGTVGSDGSLTATGLADATRYYAAAQIGGVYRYVSLQTPPLSQSVGTGNGLPSTPLTKTANYTAAAGDLVQADASAGGFTITLPSSPATGALVTGVKTDSSTNAVAVVPSGGGTINGDTDVSLDSQHATVVFEHLGSNAWRIVAMFAAGVIDNTVDEVRFFGHSFVTGTGATAGNPHTVIGNAPSSQYGYTQRITKALNCREFNKGVGGSKAQTGPDAGSWIEVPKAFAHAAPKISAPLLPRAQIVSLDWGVNEVDDAPSQIGFKHAMRSAVCLSRMAFRFQAADPSVSTVGGTLQGANLIYSGDRLISYNSNGNTVTVAVPSWLPGGEVCCYFMGSDTKGGIITPTVDGTVGSPSDFTTPTNKVGKFTCCVIRFTLAAGAHTIVLTESSQSAGGGLYFDSWTMQAASPPLVIVQDVTHTGTNASPSLYATTKASIASVVAEFPADEVKKLARAALFTDIDSMLADGTHPTDYGHGVISKAFLDLLDQSSYPTARLAFSTQA